MDIYEYITLGIAVWGAIISTGLAIREYHREKRKIDIMLIFEQFRHKHKISIVNIGKRPITICDISLEMKLAGTESCHPVPRNARFQDPFDSLPKVLTDGQKIDFYLTDVLTKIICDKKDQLLISVFDAENNVYNDYRTLDYNEKYGYFSE